MYSLGTLIDYNTVKHNKNNYYIKKKINDNINLSESFI